MIFKTATDTNEDLHHLQTVYIGYKPVYIGYKPVYISYETVYTDYKTVYTDYKTVYTDYKTVHTDYKTVYTDYKTILQPMKTFVAERCCYCSLLQLNIPTYSSLFHHRCHFIEITIPHMHSNSYI